MAITQAQYDTWEAEALAAQAARKGAKSVRFADREEVFETWDQVQRWLSWMKSQVAGASNLTRYAATRKGL